MCLPVTDDQAVPGLSSGQAEICVFQLQHSLQEIGLKFKPLGLSQ